MSNEYIQHYLGIENTYPSAFALKCFLGNNPQWSLKREELLGKTICDIGFGDGRDLNLFLDLGMEVSGLEPDPEVVKHTLKKFKSMSKTCDLRVGTNIEIPFGENTFDYVYSSAAIYYLPSAKYTIMDALFEVKRVLKPGGLFFVSFSTDVNHTVNGANWLDKNRIILEDAFYKFRKGQLYHVYNSTTEVHNDLLEVGIEPAYIGKYFVDWFGTEESWFICIGKNLD